MSDTVKVRMKKGFHHWQVIDGVYRKAEPGEEFEVSAEVFHTFQNRFETTVVSAAEQEEPKLENEPVENAPESDNADEDSGGETTKRRRTKKGS